MPFSRTCEPPQLGKSIRLPVPDAAPNVGEPALPFNERAKGCRFRRYLLLVGLLLTATPPGCSSVMSTPAPATAPTALAWLTNWVSQPLEPSDRLDLEVLRPARSENGIAADSLLEITVWDLFEPGQPHTFPVRVSPESKIDVPLLGEIGVEHQSIAGLEEALRQGYKSGEFLVQPRLLVRAVDAPLLKVHVQGAVARTGPVELPRHDASVYAALLAAGGFGKQAGTQIGVSRRSSRSSRNTFATSSAGSTLAVQSAAQTTIETAATQPGSTHTVLKANSHEEISVPNASSSTEPSAASTSTIAGESNAAEAGRTTENQSGIKWYDLTRMPDRNALRDCRLSEGDVVIVKAVAPPVRISGVVAKPGRYNLPAGRPLNVWDALELAGGVQVTDAPVNVTVIRPAAEGRAPQRWFLSLESMDQRPRTSPFLQPGDVVHVEPTAARKIKQAVGDLWSK